MPESDTEDIQIEDQLRDDTSEEVLPFKYSITSYGADYTVDSLVKRLTAEDIFVPTFQRAYVWNLSQASRFIESLLLGLPVPGIFLAKEQRTQKLLVIDGQQRLRTLQFFYEGIFANTGKEFTLRGIASPLNGATYKSLDPSDRRRLDDSILHATIVKQDEPSDDNSSIYHIFERLNTGGILLSSQEIRACIYHGAFNTLLVKLNENDDWRATFGRKHSRMRDLELLLRFFALLYDRRSYEPPMKGFLNNFMGQNQDLAVYTKEQLTKEFERTIKIIRDEIGERAFKPERALNAAVFDAVMVGIARRLQSGRPIEDSNRLRDEYESLMSNDQFNASIKTGTSQSENVSRRLQMAEDAFARVP